jgi:uncharacterized protein involved in exopolysaccharide biosynthesis/Mrp family chromosome partitioning ATPase
MTDENATTQTTGIGLQDLIHALFKRKWLILGLSASGVLAAGALFFTMKPVYQSEAKLLLRYVQENRSASTVDKDAQIKSPDVAGEGIINSEKEILNSLDLALQVAEIVGPEKIQGTAGKDTNVTKAALVIQRGLDVSVPAKSSVIRLLFTHTDPDVTQAVLTQLIRSYLKKHVELHRGLGDLEKFLAQQTDQLKARLNHTDDAMRKIKESAGLIAPDETRKAYIEQIAKVRQELFEVEAEIAERKALLGETGDSMPSKGDEPGGKQEAPAIPSEKVSEYRDVCAELSRDQAARRELLARFTMESPSVQQLTERVNRAEQQKRRLETEFPKLATLDLPAISTGTNTFDIASETTRLKALEAKAKVLSTQLTIIKTEAAGLEKAESEIQELMRQRQVEEAHFLSYSKSLEQARIQENLGAGKITNIGEVQAPSFPTRSRKAIKKMMIQAAGLGIAVALALALALELFLDQSIKRPLEIETRLKLSLFFASPALTTRERKLLKNSGVDGRGEQPGGGQVTVWNGTGPLRPYFEAMRDRLIRYFEVRKMTHKPKLVAVTGCGTGAGVSSVAKGLALSLSEAGDGNILLVDMSTDQGAAHSFMNMESCPELTDALETETRQSAKVQDKLYLAKASDMKEGIQKVMPRRFNHLMPKMKASDYDFIIFDLPPVNATSITPRLAGFMDLVLEVVEAEKTSRDVAKRAADALSEVQPNVSVVVNKCQKRLPNWLHQDF